MSDKLHILDACAVKAKVDLYRLKREHQDDDPADYIDKHSPDQDAGPGHKSRTKNFFGYQAHCLTDAGSGIIVNIRTTPGNVPEHTQVQPLLDTQPKPAVFTADKAYDHRKNHGYLSENKIRNGIILRKNRAVEYLKEHIKRAGHTAEKTSSAY